jgi:nicotinamidase/pyrazinamidase
MVDPFDPNRQRRFAAADTRTPLLVPLLRGRARASEPEALCDVRDRVQAQLRSCHAGIQRFANPPRCPVGLELGPAKLRTRLIREARGLACDDGNRFDLVVATLDCHPPDRGSFVTQHPNASVGDIVDLCGLQQVVWPVHCVEGTRGAELHANLDRTRIARVFSKGTDRTIESYGGFFENGMRKAPGLGDYLKQAGVTDVYVTGLATDYCVKLAGLDAVGLGFRTHLFPDGCRAVDLAPGDGDRATRGDAAAGVPVVHERDVT